ncbi:MAG: NTP transferase domain-containing protein, partial [Halalkalicoccus sp.]
MSSQVGSEDVHAVVLAAGVGSRLRPLTDGTPKTLLPVNGRPILGHILDSLLEVGYERV